MLKLKNNGEMKWVYGQRIGRKEEGGGSLSCQPWGRREAHNFDEKSTGSKEETTKPWRAIDNNASGIYH